jgi:UrcA family protein
MSQLMKYALAAVAAVVLTGFQGAAFGSSSDQTQITVRYADLDLNRPEDIKILYHRIELAANLVCGEGEVTGSHLPRPSWERCMSVAVNSAVTQVDRAALSAYHSAHSANIAGRS